MSIERILSRLTGAEPVDAATEPLQLVEAELRGSGSWANEWADADRALIRAKSRALTARRQRAEPPEGERGSVAIRPLMGLRGLRLHECLLDKLEEQAPTCSLHAGVAMGAFLKADRREDGSDRLADLFVDLLVVDCRGIPLVALLYDDPKRPQHQLRRVDALLDAGLPHVEMPGRAGIATVWAEVAPHLPGA